MSSSGLLVISGGCTSSETVMAEASCTGSFLKDSDVFNRSEEDVMW